MAQKEDFRKELLKTRKEFNKKVKEKNQNYFTNEKLNKKEKGMLSLKFQIGRLDWLIIYVDKNQKEILEKLTSSTNTNQVERAIVEALKNNFKCKIIFNIETKNEIIIEYDSKETFEKYSKYTFELTQQLRSASIEN